MRCLSGWLLAWFGLAPLSGCGKEAPVAQSPASTSPATTTTSHTPPTPDPVPMPAPADVAANLRKVLERHDLGSSDIVRVFHRPGVVIYGFHVRAMAAGDTWEALHKHRSETGYYPVIMADIDTLSTYADQTSESPSSIMSRSESVDLDAWASDREYRDTTDWSEITLTTGPASPRFDSSMLSIPTDALSGRSRDEVWIAMVPVREGYEVAAHIATGAWNEHPDPAVDVAMQRSWFERYGAEVVAMTHDVLEMRCNRPPRTREDVIRLAGEQYAYCPDVVEQGVGEVSELAEALRDSAHWYFWWD